MVMVRVWFGADIKGENVHTQLHRIVKMHIARLSERVQSIVIRMTLV